MSGIGASSFGRALLVAAMVTLAVAGAGLRVAGRAAALGSAVGAVAASAIQIAVLSFFAASARRAELRGAAGVEADETARSLAGAAGISAVVRLAGGGVVMFVVLSREALAPWPFVGGFVAAYVALEIVVDSQLIAASKVDRRW